jgi:hypothetical protein
VGRPLTQLGPQRPLYGPNPLGVLGQPQAPALAADGIVQITRLGDGDHRLLPLLRRRVDFNDLGPTLEALSATLQGHQDCLLGPGLAALFGRGYLLIELLHVQGGFSSGLREWGHFTFFRPHQRPFQPIKKAGLMPGPKESTYFSTIVY